MIQADRFGKRVPEIAIDGKQSLIPRHTLMHAACTECKCDSWLQNAMYASQLMLSLPEQQGEGMH